MRASHTSNLRTPGLLAFVAIVCVVVFLAGRKLFRSPGAGNARPPGPAAIPDGMPPRAARADLAVPDEASTRSGARAPSESSVVAGSEEPVDANTPERDLRREAWELVAQLEDLARAPKTFHGAALPVVDRLTEVCSSEAPRGGEDSALDARTVVEELHRDLVADPERDALVRGAVFLALAPVVSEIEFWGTFSEWTSGHPLVPLELVRAAALAAARTGGLSPCKFPLPLAKLTELPTLGSPDLPGFYPLALDRIASGRACDAIRRWLDLDDPRKSLFRIRDSAPPADADLAAAGDYFVTVEVLLCVWGHRSLEDTLVERAVLAEARFSLEDLPERGLVSLRAANFLVLSLARCNESFLDAAVAMTADSDAPNLDFVSEMQGMLGEELGLVTIARLERLRYSESPSDQADFTLALLELRNEFRRGETHDPDQRAVLLDYLCGVAADPGASSIVRTCAVNAIGSGGSWDAIREAAATSFQQGAPFDLSVLILGPMMAAARSNPAHRAEALELLHQFVAQSPAYAAQLDVDAYIAELTE
jgi:hypothetical protein